MPTWSKGAWNRANALLREALGHWSGFTQPHRLRLALTLPAKSLRPYSADGFVWATASGFRSVCHERSTLNWKSGTMAVISQGRQKVLSSIFQRIKASKQNEVDRPKVYVRRNGSLYVKGQELAKSAAWREKVGRLADADLTGRQNKGK